MTTEPLTWADDVDLGHAIERAFHSYSLPLRRSETAPAPRRRGRRFAIGAAAAALTLVVIVPMATAPSAAFATWVPAPSTPNMAIVATVNQMCHPPIDQGAPPSEQAFQARLAALPLAVVDQRGRAAMLMFARRDGDGIATNLCLGAVDEHGTLLGGGSGGGFGGVEEPADGPLRVVTGARNTRHGPDIWTMIGGGEIYTAYGGTIEPSVEGVTVERSDGVAVEASVGNGFFAVWWPGDGVATAFSAFDRDGNALATLDSGDWGFPE